MAEENQKDYGQFRRPTGEQGHEVVKGMNRSHYELTTWGLEQVRVHTDNVILDIGCGGGITVERLAALAPTGTVCGVDHSRDCVNWAYERNRKAAENGQVRIMQASVENLPFDGNYFDKVFAVETVYFWPDLPKNFAEVARVVKPGGQFIIIHEAYACEQFRERNEQLKAEGHMKILSPEKTEALLRHAGFSKVTTHTWEEKNWMCCVAEKND